MTATLEKTLPQEDRAPEADDFGHIVCNICYDVNNLQYGELVEAVCGYKDLFEGWDTSGLPYCLKCNHGICKYCGDEAW